MIYIFKVAWTRKIRIAFVGHLLMKITIEAIFILSLFLIYDKKYIFGAITRSESNQFDCNYEKTLFTSPADFAFQCGSNDHIFNITCITANQTQKNLFLFYIFTVTVVSSALIMIEIMYSVLMFIIHNPICRSRT